MRHATVEGDLDAALTRVTVPLGRAEDVRPPHRQAPDRTIHLGRIRSPHPDGPLDHAIPLATLRRAGVAG